MEILFVAGAAFLGGIVSALLGWTESTEPFNPKKFGSSIIRSIVAAAGVAAAFDYGGGVAAGIGLLIAFLAGVGVDAGGNKIAGAISARKL